jgi:hypothetical protein
MNWTRKSSSMINEQLKLEIDMQTEIEILEPRENPLIIWT